MEAGGNFFEIIILQGRRCAGIYFLEIGRQTGGWVEGSAPQTWVRDDSLQESELHVNLNPRTAIDYLISRLINCISPTLRIIVSKTPTNNQRRYEIESLAAPYSSPSHPGNLCNATPIPLSSIVVHRRSRRHCCMIAIVERLDFPNSLKRSTCGEDSPPFQRPSVHPLRD